MLTVLLNKQPSDNHEFKQLSFIKKHFFESRCLNQIGTPTKTESSMFLPSSQSQGPPLVSQVAGTPKCPIAQTNHVTSCPSLHLPLLYLDSRLFIFTLFQVCVPLFPTPPSCFLQFPPLLLGSVTYNRIPLSVSSYLVSQDFLKNPSSQWDH